MKPPPPAACRWAMQIAWKDGKGVSNWRDCSLDELFQALTTIYAKRGPNIDSIRLQPLAPPQPEPAPELPFS
jgi:hypothetical protein